VEVRNDTPNSSPSRDLFIDTLTVILVSNHETDPPKQQETETIPRTPSLIRDEPDDQQILSADKIWHPPVLDLSKLNEKEVMNLSTVFIVYKPQNMWNLTEGFMNIT
jgi:hypothetical protein